MRQTNPHSWAESPEVKHEWRARHTQRSRGRTAPGLALLLGAALILPPWLPALVCFCWVWSGSGFAGQAPGWVMRADVTPRRARWQGQPAAAAGLRTRPRLRTRRAAPGPWLLLCSLVFYRKQRHCRHRAKQGVLLPTQVSNINRE